MKNLIKVLLSVFLVSLASNNVYASVAGHVQFVHGEVQRINLAGKTHAIKKGEAIDEGDTLVSSESASAQIKMRDNGLIAMRPSTELKFDTFTFNGQQDGTEKSFFSLVKGGFRAVTGLIGKVNKDNYRISTPSATIGIRGTDHETFVVISGSTLALTSPVGTYNKVNMGETIMHNGKGSMTVLPNQMCFAGAADQRPVLKAVDTDIFTVMSTSRGNKKENDMQENMTDDDSQKGEHEGEVRESVKGDDDMYEQPESLEMESTLPHSKDISHPIKGTETGGGQAGRLPKKVEF